jgi:hypothetical protein
MTTTRVDDVGKIGRFEKTYEREFSLITTSIAYQETERTRLTMAEGFTLAAHTFTRGVIELSCGPS